MKKIKNYFLLSRLIGRTQYSHRNVIYTFAFLIILPLMALIPNKVFSQGWTIKAYLDCNPNPVSAHLHCNSTGADEDVSLTGPYNCCGWYSGSLTGTSVKVPCSCPDATITLGGLPVLLDSIINSPIPYTNRAYRYIFCCPGVSTTCTTNGCGVVTVDPSTCTITISKPVWCP